MIFIVTSFPLCRPKNRQHYQFREPYDATPNNITLSSIIIAICVTEIPSYTYLQYLKKVTLANDDVSVSDFETDDMAWSTLPCLRAHTGAFSRQNGAPREVVGALDQPRSRVRSHTSTINSQARLTWFQPGRFSCSRNTASRTFVAVV